MAQQTILSDRNSCKQTISNLKSQWVRSILEQTGLYLSNCYSDSEEFEEQTVQQKSLLRKILTENNIVIIEQDEACTIYIQNEIIAEWEKPSYILKSDLSQLDKSKQLYVEAVLTFRSVFDQDT